MGWIWVLIVVERWALNSGSRRLNSINSINNGVNGINGVNGGAPIRKGNLSTTGR